MQVGIIMVWKGFYVAPAPDHYRCLTCYLPKTKSEVIADTVKFLPRYIPIPETSFWMIMSRKRQMI